ncbi:uncharacterized protein LOC62_04G006102 [Vanrija pseudolonga]|uniref:Uncharacterized protein n=1 Tax=Vanrija pseudolonga TaxID=143232 RepID=A0AAF0YAV7_9TREE|nr:hypothetical protein LOC62_04G006102 [Vanrija pseudolonga]
MALRRPVTPPPPEFETQAPTPMLTARTFVVICYISVAPWIQFHEYILPQHEDERFAEYYDHWIRFDEDPEAFLRDRAAAESVEEGEGEGAPEDELALDASWYYRAMGQQ